MRNRRIDGTAAGSHPPASVSTHGEEVSRRVVHGANSIPVLPSISKGLRRSFLADFESERRRQRVAEPCFRAFEELTKGVDSGCVGKQMNLPLISTKAQPAGFV